MTVLVLTVLVLTVPGLTAPVLTAPGLKVPDVEVPGVAFGRLNILVVDDDARCLGSLEDFLGDEGHEIHTATRGTEALEIARHFATHNRSFELSILDFHVPDMSGLETYDGLVDLLPDMRAIFISGECSGTLEQEVLRVGGLALIEKPLDLGEMRRAIREFRGRFPEM